MNRHMMFSTTLLRRVISLCLVGMITACNSSISTNPPTSPTVSPSTPITATTNPPSVSNSSLPPPNLVKARVLDLAGLLHIDFYSVKCMPELGGSYQNAIVLAKNRLEYDSGEIQQMSTYLGQDVQGYVNDTSYPPVPPATLSETSGSLIGTDLSQTTCSASLQITNIAKSAIQITGVNMRLLSDAQLNQYQYHLIDVCSFPSTSNVFLCPINGGGGQTYPYDFNFSMAKASAVFSGKPENGQPLIEPGQVAFILLNYLSSKNLIYSVAPEITVSQKDEQRTLTLSQLTSSLAFAKPDQFSCYQLQGNTFTQISLNAPEAMCL